MKIFIYFLLIVNIIGAYLVFFDKRAAQKHQWRIRESTFFLFSALGGSVGVYSAMRLFHHKTLHKRFMIGIPLIALTEITAFIGVYINFKGALF